MLLLVMPEPLDEPPPHAAKMIAPANAAKTLAVKILVFIALVLSESHKHYRRSDLRGQP
jgi:hypothetical protein